MEGVHPRCTDITSEAAPVTCGQAIDVPDFMPNWDGFIPIGTFPGSLSGIVAAKMATPGAIISGCTIKINIRPRLMKEKYASTLC